MFIRAGAAIAVSNAAPLPPAPTARRNRRAAAARRSAARAVSRRSTFVRASLAFFPSLFFPFMPIPPPPPAPFPATLVLLLPRLAVCIFAILHRRYHSAFVVLHMDVVFYRRPSSLALNAATRACARHSRALRDDFETLARARALTHVRALAMVTGPDVCARRESAISVTFFPSISPFFFLDARTRGRTVFRLHACLTLNVGVERGPRSRMGSRASLSTDLKLEFEEIGTRFLKLVKKKS